jgi:hypothetical protein
LPVPGGPYSKTPEIPLQVIKLFWWMIRWNHLWVAECQEFRISPCVSSATPQLQSTENKNKIIETERIMKGRLTHLLDLLIQTTNITVLFSGPLINLHRLDARVESINL